MLPPASPIDAARRPRTPGTFWSVIFSEIEYCVAGGFDIRRTNLPGIRGATGPQIPLKSPAGLWKASPSRAAFLERGPPPVHLETHMRFSPTRRIIPAVAAGALVLAACGSDDADTADEAEPDAT